MAAQTGANKGTANKISSYFKGVKSEVKKVNWPNRKELVNHTAVVLGVCGAMGLLIWLVDTGFHGLLSLILGL